MRRTITVMLNFLILLLFFCMFDVANAEEWKLLFGLRGQWKFELGDDMNRAKQKYDDRQWESIHAPSPWEDEGFPGYDGYAWYRKHFHSASDWDKKSLALLLGVIDDVDEVYLNGVRVGSTGSFPPQYSTAYYADRIYPFSPSLLNPDGDNVVAIRVYDQELSGGILRGTLGVYEDRQALQVDFNIAGAWKFNIGDNKEWKEPDFNDHEWDNIVVPSFWETQGYPDYDGFGWYRVKFRSPAQYTNRRMILILGKIDDFDETYLNGEQVGQTGSMRSRDDIPGSDAYQHLRGYYIPSNLLRSNEPNVLAIRVYDGFKDGGIYAGPIGLVTKEKYAEWKNKQKKAKNIFDWLFK